MKKRDIIIALALLTISACAEDEERIFNPDRQVIITAFQEDENSTTRTTVLDAGTVVYWEPGDEVKVFLNGTGSRFTSQNVDLSRRACFLGTLQAVIGFDEDFYEDNPIWGLYPYRDDATSDGASVTTSLPSEQTGKAGSFAKDTYISLGQSSGLTMAFYAVCGGIRFTLSRGDINSVTFKGQGEEPVAGVFRTAFENGVPVVKEVLEPLTVITLKAPDGECFIPGQWYYIVALPCSLSNGFEMSFKTAEESLYLKSNNPVSIKRKIFGSIELIDTEAAAVSIPDAIDLGLPSGTLWASCNLGASAPEGIGDRYAWGETQSKSYYDWDNYKWCNGTYNSLTKYCSKSYYGTVDNKLKLDDEDDVAIVLLGKGWHMPDNVQMQELIDNCSWSSESLNGVAGYRVTGPNSNSIFIPENGQFDESGIMWSSHVFLWTSETDGSYYAYRCEYYTGAVSDRYVVASANHRHDGLCVRPVIGNSGVVSQDM